MRDGKELQLLELEELLEILEDDALNVKSEEFVFEAIKKWVDHDAGRRKAHMLALIKTVRLGTLTREFVTNLMGWEPVQESEASRCQRFEKSVEINLPSGQP